jgi:hypothetical protein
MCSILWNSLFPSTKSFGFIISKEWINEQKKDHKIKVQQLLDSDSTKNNSSSIKNTNNDDMVDVPFVSTNHVVVSRFFNALRCDLAVMAINFHGKIDGCNEDDVGNYEDLIFYTKHDYVTPSSMQYKV